MKNLKLKDRAAVFVTKGHEQRFRNYQRPLRTPLNISKGKGPVVQNVVSYRLVKMSNGNITNTLLVFVEKL